jgi:hypothetical protein
LLDNLLFRPDSALIRQSYMPKMLHMRNLAGFGLRAWDPQRTQEPQTPFLASCPPGRDHPRQSGAAAARR